MEFIKKTISKIWMHNHRFVFIFDCFLGAFLLIAIIVLFLPWTQNVAGKGYVTTLTPDQRPQTIQSPIPGRIEKWYVKEGDYVIGDSKIRTGDASTDG